MNCRIAFLIALGLVPAAAYGDTPAARDGISWYVGPRAAACIVEGADGARRAMIQVNGPREHFCVADGKLLPSTGRRERFAPDSDSARLGCAVTLARTRNMLTLADPRNSCQCPAGATFVAVRMRASPRPTMKICSVQ